MKLTKRSIDTFTYQGDGQSRDVRWDDAMPGFGVRIYPSGRKAFVLSYRNGGGKKRLVVLGTYGRDLTLEQAREKAVKESGTVIDGIDPVKQRRLEREKERTGDRFKDVAETFITRHVKQTLRPSSAKEYERIIRRNLIPKWSRKSIEEITRHDIITLLDTVTDRGATVGVNRVLAVTRKLFNWCVERGVIEATPVMGVKPPGKETKRDRVLSDDELRLVWKASDEQGWPFGPFTKLLILTAQRRGEVAAMRWADLNLEGDEPVWTLPREATKANRLHTVPLSPQAVEIINALPKMEGEHVFSTRYEETPDGKRISRPISGFGRSKQLLDKGIAEAAEKAGLAAPEAWRHHDLRRSAASGMARLNVQPHILSRVLNHAPGSAEGVTAIYNRHHYHDELRHALTVWAAHVERIVTGKTAENVVELATA